MKTGVLSRGKSASNVVYEVGDRGTVFGSFFVSGRKVRVKASVPEDLFSQCLAGVFPAIVTEKIEDVALAYFAGVST